MGPRISFFPGGLSKLTELRFWDGVACVPYAELISKVRCSRRGSVGLPAACTCSSAEGCFSFFPIPSMIRKRSPRSSRYTLGGVGSNIVLASSSPAAVFGWARRFIIVVDLQMIITKGHHQVRRPRNGRCVFVVVVVLISRSRSIVQLFFWQSSFTFLALK